MVIPHCILSGSESWQNSYCVLYDLPIQYHTGGNHSLVKHLSPLWLNFILLVLPSFTVKSSAFLSQCLVFLLSLTCLHRMKCLRHCILWKKYWSLGAEILSFHPTFYLLHGNAISMGELHWFLKCRNVGFILQFRVRNKILGKQRSHRECDAQRSLWLSRFQSCVSRALNCYAQVLPE